MSMHQVASVARTTVPCTPMNLNTFLCMCAKLFVKDVYHVPTQPKVLFYQNFSTLRYNNNLKKRP